MKLVAIFKSFFIGSALTGVAISVLIEIRNPAPVDLVYVLPMSLVVAIILTLIAIPIVYILAKTDRGAKILVWGARILVAVSGALVAFFAIPTCRSTAELDCLDPLFAALVGIMTMFGIGILVAMRNTIPHPVN